MDQPLAPTPPVFTQTPVEPEPVKKSYALLIVAVIAFLLIASSVLAYKYFQLKQQVAQTQPTPSPTPLVSPEPSAKAETADWKTYTDPKSVFSFGYPENLEYLKFNNGVVGFFENKSDFETCKKETSQGIRRIDTPCLNSKFSFNGFKALSPTQYQNYLQENKEGGNLLGQKDFIDPQNRSWQTYMALGEVYNFTGILNQQNKYYVVDLQSGFGEEVDVGATFRNLADQILSTFKFTETEKGVCKPTYKVAETPELSAEQNYSLECSLQRNESDCLKVDIYNLAKKDFSQPDGISDCKWTKSI